MAGILSADRIIESEKINEKIKSIGVEMSKLITIIDNVATAGAKITTALGAVSKLSDISAIDKQSAENAKNLATQKKAVLDIEAKVVVLLEKEAKARAAEAQEAIKSSQAKTQAIINEEKAIQAKIKTDKDLLALEKQQEQVSKQKIKLSAQEAQIAKLQEIANKSLAGSFDQLNAKYKLNIIELQGMSEAQRNSSIRAKDLIAENAILSSKLNQLDLQSGKTKRSFNGLQWQVSQLAREVPSMAYGMNVFFGAISNNLPMLIDEIKAVSAANKIASEQGRATVPVWKQVAGSIINWQTAIIIALTALTLYGREIASWTKELFKGRDAVNSFSEAIKNQEKTSIDLRSEMEKEKTSMKLNYLVAKDITRSYDERLGAANKLISKYPDILGNFTAEQILTNKLSTTYEELTKVIEKSFEARFAETKILDNYREMAKQQKIIEQGGSMWGKFSRLTVKYTKDIDVARAKIETIRKENQELFKQFNVTGDDEFGIKAASKEFEIYAKLQSTETKKVFDERSSFISKDSQTYEQWLKNQLIVYKDNVDAKIALEQELSRIQEKDKKGNQFTALEKMQDQHKKELEETARYQQELLSNTELSESQILQAKSDNSKELIRLRMSQIDEEKKLATKEEVSTLSVEYAKNEKDLAKNTSDFVIAEQKRLNKELIDEEKRVAKERLEIRKKLTDDTIAELNTESNKQKLRLQEIAVDEIKAARGNKDEIANIQHELTMNMLAEDEAAQQAILDTANLEPNAYEQASERLRRLRLQRGEEEISWAERIEQKKDDLRQQTAQKTVELLNEGFNLASKIYDAQLSRAEAAYKSETDAAGDSLQEQIIAKRKYEKESNKIRRNQAIAEKAQAAMNIAFSTAQALIAVWAQFPLGAPVLTALIAAIGATQLADVLATPIPAFFKGTTNAPETFIAGDTPDGKGASEIIQTKSGLDILTPAKATLFSDPMFKGSTILPKDKTNEMLANYAINGGSQVFVDMSGTNKYLNQIAQNTKNNEISGIDAKGRQFIKRGSVVTHY